MIKTPRLVLVPATGEMLRSEGVDKLRLSFLLKADVPNSWPPPTLKDAFPWFIEQLEKNPGHECWYLWYVLFHEESSEENTLIGTIGFLGAPDDNGMVEIGYSVIEEYQGRAIATEMASAITEWAFLQNGVKSVTAKTTFDNIGSIKVLEKCNFQFRERDGQRVHYVRYRG